MQKLCDMLGTKYIYDEYFNDLKDALSSVKEIDLADCKFTPKCERVLRDYYSTVLMRNTKDKDLDNILLCNVSAKNSTIFKSQPIRVNFNNMDEVMEYIRELPADAKLNLDSYLNNTDRCAALVVLLTLRFPSIVIDLGARAREIFEFARSEWLVHALPHDVYNIVDDTAIYEVVKNEDGEFVLPDKRKFTEEALRTMCCVMPVDFGKDCLVQEKEYSMLWKKCLSVLHTSFKDRRTMMDIIGEV